MVAGEGGRSTGVLLYSHEVVLAVHGLDGIVAEHLLYCSERRCTTLAMCLSGLLVHGCLPDSIFAFVLVPMIKDKTGRIDRIDKNDQLL